MVFWRIKFNYKIIDRNDFLLYRNIKVKAIKIGWHGEYFGNSSNSDVITPVIVQIQFVWSSCFGYLIYLWDATVPAVCVGFPNHRFVVKRRKEDNGRAIIVIDVKVRVRRITERMVRRSKRGNINGHGECGFNYCRRRVRVAVYIHDTSFTEIICAVRWSHSRLHGPQFSLRSFASF